MDCTQCVQLGDVRRGIRKLDCRGQQDRLPPVLGTLQGLLFLGMLLRYDVGNGIASRLESQGVKLFRCQRHISTC